MRTLRTCPQPVDTDLNRRGFLKRSVLGATGAVAALSLEERALQAAGATPTTTVATGASGQVPMGKIGNVEISRLICGGNLISGYAHARDLIYMSRFLKEYFTDDRILNTWQVCEEHGINTMIVNPDDDKAVQLFKRYRKERGGKMQWLAQTGPKEDDMGSFVRRAIDNGAAAVFLLGNLGDQWTFEQKVDRIGEFVASVRKEGVVSGVAGHSLEMLEAVSAAGIPNDFFMKTLHHSNYWSARRDGQDRPVIKNYAIDNYYDMEPDKTIAFMARSKKPWIAYKVLAAGAIHPRDGFDYAFKNGADFACVGMFDFQVAEDVEIANTVISRYAQRERRWCA
ncbi:MAG: hypothetical protein KDM81_01835 [Verrucomicrobiae bacterium]|nr:hypothetical protein [Verrucomicrobiae bacterium]